MQGLRSLLQACTFGLCACAAASLDAQPLTLDGPAGVSAVPNRAPKVEAAPKSDAAPKVARKLIDPRVLSLAVRVPVRNFIGKSYREAEVGLAQGQLQMNLQWTPSSRPRGKVLTQEPVQGEVPPGSIVRVEASDGSLVRVPELRRQSMTAAEAAARASGLRIQASYQPAAAPAGTVVDQQPRAEQEVKRGTVVTVLVAQGEVKPPPAALVSVPDLLRADENTARERLRGAGLRAARREAPSEQVSAGFVIAQEPRAGALVERDSEVRILVATAPAPSLVWVPSVVGQPEPVARQQLQVAGGPEMRAALRVRTELRASSAPAQRVVAQDPMNQKVPRGTTVTLVLSDGSMVRVPNVQGRDEGAAGAGIQAAGLQVLRRERPSDQLLPGSVIVQSPQPGAEVASGSAVTITVATALPPALVRAPEQRPSAQEPAGSVIAQDPRPRQEVRRTPPVTSSIAPAPPSPTAGKGTNSGGAGRPPTGNTALPASSSTKTLGGPPTPPTTHPVPGLWFVLGVVTAALAAWLLNRRPPPDPARRQVSPPAAADPKPGVRAEWTGPVARARLSSQAGEPVRLAITVSPVHAVERPNACVSEHEEEVIHG